MYQENELKKLYERLKVQYPQYQVEFFEGSLTLSRLYSKIEINRSGAKLYVNGDLYDQFTSEDVDNLDDLYELMELFLLDLQHAGMKQGNETYLNATKRGIQASRRFLIPMAICLTAAMIGLIVTRNPWLIPPAFLLPVVSLVVLKQIRKRVFQKYWVCPSCGRPLPMGGKGNSDEMQYVPQCPCCGKPLEQPPDLEPIQKEYAPQNPLELSDDLPAPSSKWPCLLSGGITVSFALLLLPLIFVSDGSEPLDMTGVWTGVVMLLYLLGFGLALMLCHHTEPEETQLPVVMVRERKIVTVFGGIVWMIGFILTLMGVIVAGTPPFEPGVTAFVAIPGVLLFLLGTWMLLAGRNRALCVFQDNSLLYINSWGRKREFAPGQVASVCLTANRSIHLLDKDRKKLASVETNMRGIPRLAEWIESTSLTAALTPAMERQEGTVQWREEYHTRWHDHIKSIRVGMWIVMAIFAAGVLAPIPLYLFAGAKFTTVMKVGALAPLPFLLFCLVFAPVLLFGDKPQNTTPEWDDMHIRVPMIPTFLIGLVYLWQVDRIWGGWVLQEADGNWGWLAKILTIDIIITFLLVLRTPKRMRLGAGLFMGTFGFLLAFGLHYCVNAALIGPALHYPAIIVDSHADDPDIDDDDYELTIMMADGKETELVVAERIYEMAINGEPLEVCHRESPFGVLFLDLHTPQAEKGEKNTMRISDFKKDTSLTRIPESSGNLMNLDLEPVVAYGRMRALFGEPNYETQNSEDAYSYILFVETESSEKIYLEVYEGSSGPAIGGLNNAESLQAAETLKKLIEESEEVADYQYEGYYQDLDLKISMGIKDGVPYYNEEPCDEIPDLQ